MKTISGSTDRVGNMIRQAGPETPPQGMTERIMHRIEVVTLKKSPDHGPIISVRGWIFIGISAFLLLVLFMQTGITGESDGSGLWGVDNLLRALPHIDKSFRFSFQVPKPLLFGLAGLLLWIGLDFLLHTLRWKRHAQKGKP